MNGFIELTHYSCLIGPKGEVIREEGLIIIQINHISSMIPAEGYGTHIQMNNGHKFWTAFTYSKVKTMIEEAQK